MRQFLTLIITVFFLQACAAAQRPPSVLDELQATGSVAVDEKLLMSDLGVLKFASKTLEHYGMRSFDSAALALGGSVAMATLSTATVAAARSASPGLFGGLAAAGNWILQILGIVKPDQRDAAFNEGSEDIMRAIGEYQVALAARRIYRIPTDRMTPQGAVLLQKTLAARIAVNRQMVGLRPRFNDQEMLQPAQPPVFQAEQ